MLASWHIRSISLRSCARKCSLRQFGATGLRGLSSSPLKATSIEQRFSESRAATFKLADNRIVRQTEDFPTDVKLRNGLGDVVGYFLPKGYPQSVGVGYDKYIKMQAVALLFSTTGGVLSMQSMLYAIGVGSGSVPLAATLNWIIKDGLGQLGGVVFASVVCRPACSLATPDCVFAAVSNRFDADPKRWRMVASGSMDVSSFIELLTPLFPHLFLPLASVANVGKNISFLAASASRAAAHRAFATHENLADITAKAGSQSILCSMLGTGLGITVATAIGGFAGTDAALTYSLTLGAFATCSAVNLTATYASLRHVTLTSLNPGRFDFLFDHWLETRELLSPSDFCKKEYLLGAPELPDFPALVIGPDLTDAAAGTEELESALSGFAHDQYVITAQRRVDRPRHARVNLLLRTAASESDLVEGLARCFLVRKALRVQGYGGASSLSSLAPGAESRARKGKWEPVSVETVLDACGAVAVSDAQVAPFMRALGLITADTAAGGASEDGSDDGPVGGMKRFIPSAMRNVYPTWHVETLLLEKRFARFSEVGDVEERQEGDKEKER